MKQLFPPTYINKIKAFSSLGFFLLMSSFSLTQVNAQTSPLFEEHFDTNLGPIQIISGSPSVSSEQVYRGGGALKMNFPAPPTQQVFTSLPPGTNRIARVFYYDTMDDSLGTIFQVRTTSEVVDPGYNTAIGVMTSVSPTNYVIRINTAGNTRDTGIKRSLGWQMFELIVTPQGTYGKITKLVTNSFGNTVYGNTISDGNNANALIPIKNPDQVSMAGLSFVSSWDLYGVAYYDELVISPVDTRAYMEQLFNVLRTFSDLYRNTDISGIPNLGDELHSNGLRTTMDTAGTFYLTGKKFLDQQLVNRGIQVLTYALTAGTWDHDHDGRNWERGVVMSILAWNTRMMWPDLPEATRQMARQRINEQIQKYIKAIDNFESGLTGWTVTQNAAIGNTVTIQSGAGVNGSNALGLAFNTNDSGNVSMVSKTITYYPSSTSIRTTVQFYDDGAPIKGTALSIDAPADANGDIVSTSIGVNTGAVASRYIFRTKVSGNLTFHDTGISRSTGWHTLELLTSNQAGTTAYIDNQPIPQTNNSHTAVQQVKIFSTWVAPSQVVYDNLVVTRMPDSGYVSDTKAEENAWHADFLASVVNFYPDTPNLSLLENLGKCYAYHTITRSTDSPYCNLKTQTVHDQGFTLENHGVVHPSYGFSALRGLGRGAFSYTITGKQIPIEFKHNVAELYNQFLRPKIETDTFEFTGLSQPLDWSGAQNTSFLGLNGIIYVQELGIPLGFTLDDFFMKRSLFFYDITCDYAKNPPDLITVFDQFDRFGDSYHWYLNANLVSNDYTLAAYYLGGVPVQPTSTPTPTPTPIPGDVTGDRRVNVADILKLLTQWNSPYNIFDYNLTVANYGRQ